MNLLERDVVVGVLLARGPPGLRRLRRPVGVLPATAGFPFVGVVRERCPREIIHGNVLPLSLEETIEVSFRNWSRCRTICPDDRSFLLRRRRKVSHSDDDLHPEDDYRDRNEKRQDQEGQADAEKNLGDERLSSTPLEASDRLRWLVKSAQTLENILKIFFK